MCWKLLQVILAGFAIKHVALEQDSFIDIDITTADMLQCNMNCISNAACVAFTLQRQFENSICKLHRYPTGDDAKDNYSVLAEKDITMIVTRGPAICASVINKSHYKYATDTTNLSEPTTNLPESTTNLPESTTNLPESTTNLPESTTNSPEQSAISTVNHSTTDTSSTMASNSSVQTDSSTKTTDSPEESTTSTFLSASTEPSTTASTFSTQTDLPTTTNDLSESTVLTETTTSPPARLQHNSNGTVYQCNAVDEMEDQNTYLFFWYAKGKNTRFSIANKNDITKTIQEDEAKVIFEGFNQNKATAVFNIDGITYIWTDNAWLTYKIERDANGLIKSATMKSGIKIKRIASATSATVIGRDYVLYQITTGFDCVHKKDLSSTFPSQPDKNSSCVQIVDLIKKNKALLSPNAIFGHDQSSFRALVNDKLYPL
ncbi:hypothetical protein CHUAL_005281 [Chamberlinius hualienensis]